MSPPYVVGVDRVCQEVFADALRAAIASRGLPLDRIRAHLSQRGHDLSSATLSNWQHGRSHPYRGKALAAIGSLELVLDVPRGYLADLVPPRSVASGASGASAGAPSSHPTAPEAGSERTGGDDTRAQLTAPDVGEIFALSWGEGYDRISTHDTITLDAHGTVSSHTVRTVVRSTVDRLERLIVGYQNDEGGDVDIVARGGCTLARTHEVARRRLQVAELRLSRGVGRGETALFEYVVRVRDSVTPLSSCLRELPSGGRETVMEVRCHPDALPAHVWQVRSSDGVERHTPLTIGQQGTITMHESGFGPGQIGMRWVWPDDLSRG